MAKEEESLVIDQEISPEVMNYRREYSSAEKVLKNGTFSLFVKVFEDLTYFWDNFEKQTQILKGLSKQWINSSLKYWKIVRLKNQITFSVFRSQNMFYLL